MICRSMVGGGLLLLLRLLQLSSAEFKLECGMSIMDFRGRRLREEFRSMFVGTLKYVLYVCSFGSKLFTYK